MFEWWGSLRYIVQGEESEASHEDVTLATKVSTRPKAREKTVLLTATGHLRWEIAEGGREAG